MPTVQNHHIPAREANPNHRRKQQLKPGLYLELLHGRDNPRSQMNGWGFEGPAIGPLKWVHTTYASEIRMEFENAIDAFAFFDDAEEFQQLEVEGDLLKFNGQSYGDWTVYYLKAGECAPPSDTFRSTPRRGNRYNESRDF